jgi:isopentenyl-diphosphate Delta-isomerase
MTVELVTPSGESVGSATVEEAHLPPGLLHRAFSVVLFDFDGRTLVQRRAATKSRFAGLWSNTCCSHPAPGQPLASFAARRLGEELRLAAPELTEAGRFTYRAADEIGGWIEHEYDHVLVGTMPAADPSPDPDEVDEWRWVEVSKLQAELDAEPAAFTPWFAQALTVALRTPF